MNDVSAAKRRWSNWSDLPVVHASSRPSIWTGFEFQEMEIPFRGSFDRETSRVAALTHTSGPIKVRLGGARRPFRDFPAYPTLCMPGDGKFGAWEGSQRGRHLFIEPDAFERTTLQPFRRGKWAILDGPNPAIEQLLRALHIDTIAGHPSGPTLGESIISSILHQIILQSGMIFAANSRARLSRSELSKVYELIEDELAGSLSLERLAASIGFSVRHLCRSFRASSGLSLHQYIVGRRIERAKALINKSELSLEEIAEAVGFAHHAHMTATFRRLIGATPVQFRSRQVSRAAFRSKEGD
jgi:AraC-like DNA-binding protein